MNPIRLWLHHHQRLHRMRNQYMFEHLGFVWNVGKEKKNNREEKLEGKFTIHYTWNFYRIMWWVISIHLRGEGGSLGPMGKFDHCSCSLSPSTRGSRYRLFWFYEGTLHVYDFAGQWSHSSPIKDLDKVVPPAILTWRFDGLLHPVLLHVAGNVFCLLCLEYLPVK